MLIKVVTFHSWANPTYYTGMVFDAFNNLQLIMLESYAGTIGLGLDIR